MKTSLVRLVALTVLVAAGAIGAVVLSQEAEPRPKPQMKKDHIVAPRDTEEAKESRPVENKVRLSNPADEKEKAVAEQFRLQPAPSVRARYFQSILNNPDFRLDKWYLQVLDVKTVDGKTTVKVRATPLVTSRFAAATLVDGVLEETYEVSGQNLKLLKTAPPVDPAAPPKRFTVQGM
jgi:hypothetical protein